MSNWADNLAAEVLDFYLKSRDFNGYPTRLIEKYDDVLPVVRQLICERKIDLVRGDIHPNPHIKALTPESVEEQIAKVETDGLAGCLYPTPDILNECRAEFDGLPPYTRALKLGAPQLSYRPFDLRSLEWYRNDPRFQLRNNDIQGNIAQRAGTKIGNQAQVRDKLDFFEFGFAFNANRERAIAAFLRYLHDLPPEQQFELARFELVDDFQLHPDYYRTSIIGDFPEGMSIFDAFLLEKKYINEICEIVGKPPMFKTDKTEQRPENFGFLMRPTKKEFREFCLLLDQLYSDDLNSKFFDGDIAKNRTLFDEDGNKVTQPIGTIQLLQNWVNKKFKPKNPEAVDAVFKDIRAIRSARMKPAHVAEENEFSQEYLDKQRELMVTAYESVKALRYILQNHPMAKGYNPPDYLESATVWLM